MNDRWNNLDHVTVPVQLVDGRWELLYGGSTGIREGTHGELRVPMSSIEDKDVRRRLGQTVTVKVLEEGAELLVALTDRDYRRKQDDPSLLDLSIISPADRPAGSTRLERIRIGARSPRTTHIDDGRGGLWIRQRGVDRTDLISSGIRMPQVFGAVEANSLNHACTLLSELYEKHRISHTVNVYKHVFYCEPGAPESSWHPLDNLRNGVIAGVERSIVGDVWANLEKQLGFRPVGKADAKQRRRNR